MRPYLSVRHRVRCFQSLFYFLSVLFSQALEGGVRPFIFRLLFFSFTSDHGLFWFPSDHHHHRLVCVCVCVCLGGREFGGTTGMSHPIFSLNYVSNFRENTKTLPPSPPVGFQRLLFVTTNGYFCVPKRLLFVPNGYFLCPKRLLFVSQTVTFVATNGYFCPKRLLFVPNGYFCRKRLLFVPMVTVSGRWFVCVFSFFGREKRGTVKNLT